MTLHERVTGYGVNDEGDVVLLEDFDAGEVHTFPHNEFRVSHGEARDIDAEAAKFDAQMLAQRRERERLIAQEAFANIPENAVFVTLEQHYRDQLDLLDAVMLAESKGGFKKGGQYTKEAKKRYDSNLPNVVAGSEVNHKRIVHHDFMDVYHAKELIDAGIEDKAVIEHDAKTTVPSEVRSRLGGEQNKTKRRNYRKYLKAKLEEHKK